MTERAAGWYPDPSGENRQRFWDGDSWTEYFQPLAPERPELHGPETAAQDYPYLSNVRGPMATPQIPPSQGIPASTQATSWAPSGPTTDWGTPAREDDYAGGEHRPPDPSWRSPGETEVFAAQKRGGRLGLILVIVISAVVLALILAGVYLAVTAEPGAGLDGVIGLSGPAFGPLGAR